MSRGHAPDPRLGALLARELGPRPRPVLAELLRLQADPLSARERAVVGYLLEGQESQAIGAALGITVKTVKSHLSTIFAKLGVVSRGEAVYLLLLLGVLALDPLEADAALLALRARHERTDGRSEARC